MINKHGVDVSKIHVGDVVAYREEFLEVTNCSDLYVQDFDWYEPMRVKDIDNIEFHYARQPREERG